MRDSHRLWWKLPQARVLFNSPYHSSTPSSRKDIICRVLVHFQPCTEINCTCMLDDYFDSFRRHLVTKSLPPTPVRSTATQLSSAAVMLCAPEKLSNSRITVNVVPESTNINYHSNLLVTAQTDIPEAGKVLLSSKVLHVVQFLGCI